MVRTGAGIGTAVRPRSDVLRVTIREQAKFEADVVEIDCPDCGGTGEVRGA